MWCQSQRYGSFTSWAWFRSYLNFIGWLSLIWSVSQRLSFVLNLLIVNLNTISSLDNRLIWNPFYFTFASFTWVLPFSSTYRTIFLRAVGRMKFHFVWIVSSLNSFLSSRWNIFLWNLCMQEITITSLTPKSYSFNSLWFLNEIFNLIWRKFLILLLFKSF